MKYNKVYMTDDRNQNSGESIPNKIPNFVIIIIAIKQLYIITDL